MRERIASQFVPTIPTATPESFAGLLTRITAAASQKEPTLIRLNPPLTVDVARVNWKREHSVVNPVVGNAASLASHALLCTRTTVALTIPRRVLLKQLGLQPHLALLLKQLVQEPQLTVPAQQPLLALPARPLRAPAVRQRFSQRQPLSRDLLHPVQLKQSRQFSKIAKMALTTTFFCIKLHPCSGSLPLSTVTVIFLRLFV